MLREKLSLFCKCHLSFVICHLSFVIGYLSLVISHWLFVGWAMPTIGLL
ncbi:MAG: hypothetical protein HEQ19_18745 [Gloeotrichia echinulata CP02]